MSLPWFPKTYDESRQRFHEALAAVRARWPEARLERHPLSEHPDLAIEWIWADAIQTPRHRLILTTGEHGIEGYLGAAMLHLFVEAFLPHLDPAETGLLLVHVINPWGMAHRRRVNAHNVDLNRNFLASQAFAAAREVNPAYEQMFNVLNPASAIPSYGWENARWAWTLSRALLSSGIEALKAATLLGQYRFPKGIYYGGDRQQEEVQTMMALYRRAWADYDQIVHLDMHTGYGPRGQMTIVNSTYEDHPPSFFKKFFGYPHVVASEPGEFYTIHGDMIDWVYSALAQETLQARVYGAAFEFGTLGDDTLSLFRSLRALVFENRAFWHGASETARQKIAAEFTALFYPQDPAWQRQAVTQARQAFAGVLRAFGLMAF